MRLRRRVGALAARVRPARRDRARVRLSVRDTVGLALLGPRTRPARAALSALGIGIGIAALVAITGATDSQQAQLRADLDAMGANLLVVEPETDPGGNPVPLPDAATGMVRRIAPVQHACEVRRIPQSRVYRSDVVPVNLTGGLSAAVTDDELPATLGIGLSSGRWFDEASRTLPTAVLGATAASRLGVTATVGARILVDGEWYAVLGVLERAGLAASVDTTVFLADGWRAGELDTEAISSIYVRTASGATGSVRDVLAATANPANPHGAAVSRLSDLADAQETTDAAMSSLVLGLAGIALLVGGIGIANTMIVAVMERRGEIGLRRALGARTGQVTVQFLLEAVVLAVLGGLAGTVLGVLAVLGLAAWQDTVVAVRPLVLAGGPLIAVVVGALAGLYPAARAAGLPPTTALRAV